MAIHITPVKLRRHAQTVVEVPRIIDPRAQVMFAQGFPLAKHLYDPTAPEREPDASTASLDELMCGLRKLMDSDYCGWYHRVKVSDSEYLAKWIGSDGVIRVCWVITTKTYCECGCRDEAFIGTICSYDLE